MRTKLAIWLSCTACIVAIAVAVVLAALGSPEGAIHAGAFAALCGFLARVFTGDLQHWRENRENRRNWKRIYPHL
jgi:hypothetical protein